MVTYEFGIEDVAAMRFAISPVHELVSSLTALRDRDTAAVHRPWLESLRGQGDLTALRPLIALVAPRGYTPDFLTPPPSAQLGAIETELAAVAATPLEQVLAEIANAKAQMGYGEELVAPWERDPAAALAGTVTLLRRFWELALADRWPRMRELLEGDIARRAAALATGGLGATLGELHPSARWRAPRLEVDTQKTETCVLGGRGLVLMPSVFRTRGAAAITRLPWHPTVIYPARGLATVWEPRTPAGPATLARVLGGARARLLAELDAPLSSTELVRRTGMSAASVSEHLAVLRDAGLASSRREGRYLLHTRTERGEQLLASG